MWANFDGECCQWLLASYWLALRRVWKIFSQQISPLLDRRIFKLYANSRNNDQLTMPASDSKPIIYLSLVNYALRVFGHG
jgi:hypothetical protein